MKRSIKLTPKILKKIIKEEKRKLFIKKLRSKMSLIESDARIFAKLTLEQKRIIKKFKKLHKKKNALKNKVKRRL